jgi:hypothetical protein
MTRPPQEPRTVVLATVGDAAKVIKHALKNVGLVCFDLLMFATMRFPEEWDDARLVTHRSVFVEIMVFLCTYRTEEEVEALREALSMPLGCEGPRPAAPRMFCNHVHESLQHTGDPVANLVQQLFWILKHAIGTRYA